MYTHLFLLARAIDPTEFLDVHLCGVDAAWYWPMHIPKCPLLTVQNLPLHLVPLFVHSVQQQEESHIDFVLVAAPVSCVKPFLLFMDELEELDNP